MIARLSGRLDSSGSDGAVIDVQGVGYLIQASSRTLSRLGRSGDVVTVVVETQIRDERIILYGFADTAERDWFRLLTTVQGVGGRLALAVLGVLEPESLARAIVAQDKIALSRADGVGPRLAVRMINELKDKVAGLSLGPAALVGEGGSLTAAGKGLPAAGGAGGGKGLPAGAAAAGAAGNTLADAVSALVNLGYGRSEAFAAVTAAAGRRGPATALATLIRESLQTLAGTEAGG